MIEVSPEVPSSIFGLGPVPKAPSRDWSLIHIGCIVSIIELGPSCPTSEIALAEFVAGIISDEIISADGYSDLDDSSSPSIVVSSIDNCKGSILNGNFVERPLERFGRSNTDEGKHIITSLIAFEGIAVIAGKPSCPVRCVAGPSSGLIGETLLDGLEAELIHIRNSSVADGVGPGDQQQHCECQINGFHQFIYQLLQNVKNYCGLINCSLVSEKQPPKNTQAALLFQSPRPFLKNDLGQNIVVNPSIQKGEIHS